MSRPGKKTVLKILGAGAFLLALALLARRQDALESIWLAISNVSAVALIGALILFAAARLAQAQCLRQALLISGECLSFTTALELSGIKGFYNLTFQGAGILAQGASGKARNIFRMRNFIASSLLQSILLALSIGVSVATLAFLLPEGRLPRNGAMLFGSGVASAALVLVFAIRRYRVHVSAFGPRINSILADVHERLTCARLGSLLIACGYQLCFAWLRLARLAFVAVVLTSEVNFLELSAIVFAADLASLVPLTPGGIGLREFVIGTGGVAVGQMEILVAAALVDRGVMILGNFAHGLLVMAGDFFRRHRL